MTAVLALVAVSVLVILFIVWQRLTRLERRAAHTEAELGIEDVEREQAEEQAAGKSAVSLRARLTAVERKTSSIDRRLLRRK